MTTPEHSRAHLTRTEHTRGEHAASLTTTDRLIVALVRAARTARAPTAELREAVSAYVRELKQRGYPPERVLVAVKALVADAGVRRVGIWNGKGSTPIEPGTEIMDRVVAWCIEEYFAGTRNADGRRP